MSYGDLITAPMPAVQDPRLSPGPGFATQYNAVLAAIQAVVEAKVTAAQTQISADVDMNDSAIAGVLEARLVPQVEALPRNRWPRALFTVEDDWYFNDGRGRTIRITRDGTVDASSTAGISGAGYGTGGVEIAWDSGVGAYKLKDGAGASDYAGLKASALRLFDGSGNYLALRAPSPEVDPGNYDLRFPTALPAAGIPAMIFALAGAGVPFISDLSYSKLPYQAVVKEMFPGRMGIGESTNPPGPAQFKLDSGGSKGFFPILVHVGQRIPEVVISGSWASGAVIALIELDYTDTTDPRYTVISTVTTSGAQTEITFTPTAPGYVALDGRFYGVRVDGTSVSDYVSWVRASLEWP